MTPMVAGTVITLISLPMYAGLNRWHGAMGLAVASDVGIGMQTLVLAWLLHRKRMVSLASLDYKELGRCLLAGSVAGAVVWAAIAGSARVVPLHGRTLDGAELVVGGVLWLVLMDRLLDGMGSALPGVARKRLGLRRSKSGWRYSARTSSSTRGSGLAAWMANHLSSTRSSPRHLA